MSLLLGILLPLAASSSWKEIKYDHIPTNEFKQSAGSIFISVNRSAGALVYVFDKPTKIARLKCSGQISSLPGFSSKSTQGEKQQDDFALRVGFVKSGDLKLSGIKKWLAPKWLKNLFNLQRKEKLGFGGLELFLIANNPGPKWTKRAHPMSAYIEEHVAQRMPQSGDFSLDIRPNSSDPKMIGVWIGADGDDTKSTFVSQINKIEIEVLP